MQRVCIFCGSNSGRSSEYEKAAITLCQALVKKNIGLVYGGASIGLMGKVADAFLAAGGDVIGVIPQSLVDREIAHKKVPDLRIVNSMHERKALMEQLSDGFIALPGGFGTLEELFEMVTWGQLGIHKKPAGVLNAKRYFDGLLKFIDHAVEEEFIHKSNRPLILESDDPDKLIEKMFNYDPPTVTKWIEKHQS